MKHYNEEELIEYYYGESDAAAEIKQHVRECAVCGAAYLGLSRDLSEIATIKAPARTKSCRRSLGLNHFQSHGQRRSMKSVPETGFAKMLSRPVSTEPQ